MAAKAASGSGSIRKKTVTRNGKKYVYWEARVTVGRDPGTGKQVQRSFSGKTQKEVREKMQAAAVALTEGTYLEPSKMTVGQWLDVWSKEYLGSVKLSTAENYALNIRKHLKPAIGAVPLQSLAPHHIQTYLNSLTDSKPNTIHSIYRVLHSALEKAVELEYIPKNPASRCELPRIEREEIRPLDTVAFLKAAEDDPFELIFKVDIFTGMRQGEILGLKWENVDFKNGTISIVRQLKCHPGGYYFTTPKSGKNRVLTPAPLVMEYLKEQRRRQAEARLKAGEAWQDSGLVFTDDVGAFLRVNTVYRHFKRIVRSMGCPSARFHDIRHTYAVNSIMAGDDIKTISENMGHATVAFTLDVYGHVTEKMRKDSANRMETFARKSLGL